MALHEFDLIGEYFTGLGDQSPDLVLGVGDDCALINIAQGHHLAITTDTLVEGVHFPVDCDPELLAQRCLRVNLSDLAAMGAEPLGFQLALTLPTAEPLWLSAFSTGLKKDIAQFCCPLMGGDTTRGPLSISITLLGQVPAEQSIRRSGAQSGDLIYVTGTLGDSRGGLEAINNRSQGHTMLKGRYWCPQPRLQAGQLLRQFASAAIDISDGLLQDVGHIARQSRLGGRIDFECLPVSKALMDLAGESQARQWALTAGDDYELCFTVSASKEDEMKRVLSCSGLLVTRIGEFSADNEGISCVDSLGKSVITGAPGYAHF